ncbi:MAG: DASS family sodium-coupled anion symporter [Burkholderiales bacterium]|nr:DASS family sodium-coupled anion symporter [Burkholderiales bacterium]
MAAEDGAAAVPARAGALRAVALLVAAGAGCAALYAWLPFDAVVRKALCLTLFIGLLWLTEVLPLAATALLVPLAALLLGFPGLTTTRAFAPFADPIVFVFFGGFALATALRVQQLDRKMAVALLRAARGHLGAAVVLVIVATAVLSMGISNTATAALMLPLALGILRPLDPRAERATYAFVLLGVAYAASIGGIGTLVGSPPNAIAARAAGIDFTGWLAIGLPLVALLLPLTVLTLWVVLRPQLGRRLDFDLTPVPWTGARLATLVVFALTALGWTVGGDLLRDAGIAGSDTVFAVAAAVAVLALGLASWREVARHTDWGVLLLFGGGLALSEVLGLSGASVVLGARIAQALGSTSPWLVLLAVAAFMVVVSEFASNTAAAALLVPVFGALAAGLGLPKETLVVLVALAASCGFALPVATPPNALVFGTGFLAQRDMLRAGLALDAVCVLVLALWALATLAVGWP